MLQHLAAASLLLCFSCSSNPSLIDFVRSHPATSSLIIRKNDSVLVSISADRKLPLASVSKTIVALCFLDKVKNGLLNPSEKVSISDLDTWNAIDDVNYENWKKEFLTGNRGDSATLSQIATGAIQHSSNVNTDFLIRRMGLADINAFKHKIVPMHDDIVPFVGSALYVLNIHNEDKQPFIEAIGARSREQRNEDVIRLEDSLLANPGYFSQRVEAIDGERQADIEYNRLWAETMAGGSAQDYLTLIDYMLSPVHFEGIDSLRREVFESWSNPDHDPTYQFVSFKTGVLPNLFNIWFYAKNRSGTRISLVLFANRLSPDEFAMIAGGIEEFLNKIVMDDGYAASLAPH